MGIHKFIKVYRDRNKTQPPALPRTNFLSGLNLIHSILLDVEVICPDKLFQIEALWSSFNDKYCTHWPSFHKNILNYCPLSIYNLCRLYN